MNGMTADGILAHARDHSADLIIMTSHGRGPVSRAFLGSVADEVVRRVSIPVIVVRPREATAPGIGDAVVRQLLVAMDLSPLSEQIIGPVLAVAKCTGATVTLLHVAMHAPSMSRSANSTSPSHEQQISAYLDGLAKRFRTDGGNVAMRIIHDHHAASAILAEASKGFDLVALTTRGHGGVKRLLLGSVADKVVRGASIPVLVFCPTDRPPPVLS
jgi:nucleotide-binding universal stress UspA family protein